MWSMLISSGIVCVKISNVCANYIFSKSTKLICAVEGVSRCIRRVQAKNKLFSFEKEVLSYTAQVLAKINLSRALHMLSMFVVQTKTKHLKQYFMLILLVECSAEYGSHKLMTEKSI